MSLPEHLDPASPQYRSTDWHNPDGLYYETQSPIGSAVWRHDHEPELLNPDSAAEINVGRANSFDSDDTHSPFLVDGVQPFGLYYTPTPSEQSEPLVSLETPVARGIHAITWLAFAIFAIAVVFFLEPLAAIFYR